MIRDLEHHALEDAIATFRDYKVLAERAFEQLGDDDFHIAFDDESNSIGVIMKHITGNMISRWTDFLTTDGEKPDRNRDAEFELEERIDRSRLIADWERGWACLFSALENLPPESLTRRVKIRGQELSVLQAINRQLTHYAYHIGQIVFVAKHIRSGQWKSLSIPKKRSGLPQQGADGGLRWAKTEQK
jgi:hypothetical protein